MTGPKFISIFQNPLTSLITFTNLWICKLLICTQFAGGLTSTSSCIFIPYNYHSKISRPVINQGCLGGSVSFYFRNLGYETNTNQYFHIDPYFSIKLLISSILFDLLTIPVLTASALSMSVYWNSPDYTLQKFWRYNKVYDRELVSLEILGDH